MACNQLRWADSLLCMKSFPARESRCDIFWFQFKKLKANKQQKSFPRAIHEWHKNQTEIEKFHEICFCNRNVPEARLVFLLSNFWQTKHSKSSTFSTGNYSENLNIVSDMRYLLEFASRSPRKNFLVKTFHHAILAQEVEGISVPLRRNVEEKKEANIMKLCQKYHKF